MQMTRHHVPAVYKPQTAQNGTIFFPAYAIGKRVHIKEQETLKLLQIYWDMHVSIPLLVALEAQFKYLGFFYLTSLLVHTHYYEEIVMIRILCMLPA